MSHKELDRVQPCPTDGELVAFLDDALPTRRAAGLQTHLDRCAVCRDRFRTIRSRDEVIREWIRVHDPSPPPPDAYDLDGSGPGRSRRSRTTRWAAAAAVVVTVGALAGPVVGWVADRLERIGSPAEPTGVEERPDADIPHATSFLVPASGLDLSFGSSATRGSLVLEPTTDPAATLEVPGPEVALTVARGRVEIDNMAEPEGLYRLQVPDDLQRVRIFVPGADPVVLDLGQETRLPLRLDLSSGAPIPPSTS